MWNRLIFSALIAVAGSIGTIVWWQNLRSINETRVAQIAEAESYAARSELVWDIEALLSELRNVRAFWSAYDSLPSADWPDEDEFSLDHLDGIELLLWEHPDEDIRYLYMPESGRLDYRPNDEEWQRYAPIVADARSRNRSAILDPLTAGDGRIKLHVIVAGPDSAREGRLVAIVDTQNALSRFLAEQSPGFAIRVESNGLTLYDRAGPTESAPEQWIRSGRITTSFGGMWTVTHSPTAAWIDSYSVAEIDLVLVLGLILSVLFATLVLESRRANARTAAAEAAERQLAEVNRNLERVVEKRTRELAARTTDLQILADSVGHDLRNPLNTLSLNVQLLQKQFGAELGNKGEQILQRFGPAIHQMTDILDRLLGLSQLTYLTFSREEFSMEELVRETCEELISSESKPVHFEIGDLPPVSADKTFVQLLLTNLLGNALKYTRDLDHREIRVDAETVCGQVVYSISDNGPGFSADVADQLFAAFRRFDDDTEGLGLGLSLVKRVVARHGGRVRALSKAGQGATFCFTLEPGDALAPTEPQAAR